jgi:hypothetical protein
VASLKLALNTRSLERGVDEGRAQSKRDDLQES